MDAGEICGRAEGFRRLAVSVLLIAVVYFCHVPFLYQRLSLYLLSSLEFTRGLNEVFFQNPKAKGLLEKIVLPIAVGATGTLWIAGYLQMAISFFDIR